MATAQVRHLGLIKHRQTGRIMDYRSLDDAAGKKWFSKHLRTLDSKYETDHFYGRGYPVGPVGRDHRFPDGLLVTTPRLPVGAIRREDDFDVKIGETTPVPIVECLIRYGPEQCIVAGELNNDIYSEKFKDTLFEQLELAKKYNSAEKLMFRTVVVCGPVAMTRSSKGNRQDHSVLPDLIEHPDVDVYYSFRRQPLHFRLALHAVYWEDWHKPSGHERRAHRICYDAEKLIEYQEKKVDLLRDASKVRLCKTLSQMKRNFVFLTKNELRQVYSLVRKETGKKKAFDTLDRDGIKPYLDELNIPC